MSSNGLVLFLVVAVVSVFTPSPSVVPVLGLALASAFTLALGRRGVVVARRAILSVAPLAIFLTLVWVVIVGRAPQVIFFRSTHPSSSWQSVAAITSRLFLLALLTFGVIEAGSRVRPLFVFGLALPREAKVLLLATTSLVGAMRLGAERAHTALVAANILTGRRSWRNLAHGWLLVRTTWVAAVGIAVERLDTKWTCEDLPGATAVALPRVEGLNLRDMLWLSLAGLCLYGSVATLVR